MNLPNIPDNFNKLLVLIGISIGLITYYDRNDSMDYFLKETEKTYAIIENIKFQDTFMSLKISYFQDIFSTKKDSSMLDSIKLLKINLQVNKSKYKYYVESLDFENFYNDFVLDKSYIWGFLASGIVFLFGMVGIFKEHRLNEKIHISSVKTNEIYKVFCQSCGIRISSFNKHGNENDGSIKHDFCSNCYDNGDFIEKDLTLVELYKRLDSENLSFIDKLIVKNRIKNLDRWRKKYF